MFHKLPGKKLLCFLLVMILSISALAGCTDKSDSDTTDTGKTNTESDGASDKDSNTESTAVTAIQAGTYTASEKGMLGDVTVKVTVSEDGTVTSIDVDAGSETPDIGGTAASKLADSIIESQSLAVDAVSGATYTSKAVLAAAKEALFQAGVDVTAWENKEVIKNGADEEVTVDVVVAGAGGSGTAAALAAAEAGLNVLIIEKTAAVGGNTSLASGMFAVGTDLQKDEGLDLSVDVAVSRLLEFNRYLSNGPLTRAIVEKSADTVKWLQKYGMEIYLQQDTTQFAHTDPYQYKGYHKFKDSAAGFKKIYENLEAMGAELRLNTSLASIIKEDGTVTGITAAKEDGGTLTVHAKSTVICTGGFGANTEKVSEVMNGIYLNTLGMPNMGEGLDALEQAGAINWDATALLHACQLAESETLTETNQDNRAGFSSSSLTQMLMSPLLWVDASGTRFVNEDVVYDTAYWANAAYSAGGRYYFIIDKKTLEDYTKGTAMLISEAGPGANLEAADFTALAEEAVKSGTAFKGSTLSELAEAAGMDADELKTTVERYNKMVKNKKDTDYNKSADSLKYTVETDDFYAFDCRAVNLGSIGGVKVNEKLEVIDNDYKQIPGLYTAGTNAGGYYEGSGYPPYEGLACGFAWTSGRIAGENAAKYAAEKE